MFPFVKKWSKLIHHRYQVISYIVKSEARNEPDAHEGEELLKSRNIWKSMKQEICFQIMITTPPPPPPLHQQSRFNLNNICFMCSGLRF